MILIRYFILSLIAAGIYGEAKSPCTISEFQKNSGIELIINNIRNKNGLIQIGVFSSEEGYPDKPTFSYTIAKDTIIFGKLRLLIPLRQSGTFCITVLDDENRNGKMDMWLGIKPKEGFGFSNNAKVPGRKPPPFKETLVNYVGGVKEVTINMKYI